LIYLLDTNVCIAYLRGSDVVLRNMATHEPFTIGLSDVVKAEMYYGARKSQKPAANLALLETFFAEFTGVPFDDKAGREYGILRAYLESAGRVIGPYDLQIAATALANSLILVTHNTREFGRVKGLRLEDWEC